MNKEEILERYREFAINVSTGYDFDHYTEQAKQLLEEDFKMQVRNLWGWKLTESWDASVSREDIKTFTKVGFVHKYAYYEDYKDFIEKHWHEIDKIIEILREYIAELEAEEEEAKKEEKE